MIVRPFQSCFSSNLIRKWHNLSIVYSGSYMHKRSYSESLPNVTMKPPMSSAHVWTTSQTCLLLSGLQHNSVFFLSRRFSTTSQNCSVSEKLGNFYAKLDSFGEKRKEFYQKFSAARFVNAAPESWKPYLEVARVDKPTGSWLLYLPCAFSICLATPLGSLPDLYYLGLFGVGAFLMRGAGCVINDLWDKDLDKHVERTKARPLASGKLTTKKAIALLAVQLSLSLGILLSLNTTCILIGVMAMIPVIMYPLAKRVTYFPQAALGLTFNLGAIMGYAAVAGHIDWRVTIPLYLACFCWTMYYDTVYAVQDADDDQRIGIKSTALLFLASRDEAELDKMPVGERLQESIKSLDSLERSLIATHMVTMMLFMLSFNNAGLTTIAYFVPAAHALKFTKMDHYIRSKEHCWQIFSGQKNFGLCVLLGIILGVYFSPTKQKENTVHVPIASYSE